MQFIKFWSIKYVQWNNKHALIQENSHVSFEFLNFVKAWNKKYSPMLSLEQERR